MKKLNFIKSATHWSQFPEAQKPEIAIAGRSNSGKSSFINSLAQSNIAKVSQKPGKTRLLNVFELGSPCYLVDMPGYGYAARSATERLDWQKMIESYLTESTRLCGIVLLMDIRRDWSEDEDLLLQFCLSRDLPLAVGLTKADKLARSKWKAIEAQSRKELDLPCFALSSVKKWGIEELLGHGLKNWVRPLKK